MLNAEGGLAALGMSKCDSLPIRLESVIRTGYFLAPCSVVAGSGETANKDKGNKSARRGRHRVPCG